MTGPRTSAQNLEVFLYSPKQVKHSLNSDTRTILSEQIRRLQSQKVRCAP